MGEKKFFVLSHFMFTYINSHRGQIWIAENGKSDDIDVRWWEEEFEYGEDRGGKGDKGSTEGKREANGCLQGDREWWIRRKKANNWDRTVSWVKLIDDNDDDNIVVMSLFISDCYSFYLYIIFSFINTVWSIVKIA